MKKRYFLLLVFALTFLPAMLSACPNCKEAYTEAGTPVSGGYNASILFLMITPFAVMGVIALRILFSVRKQRRIQQAHS